MSRNTKPQKRGFLSASRLFFLVCHSNYDAIFECVETKNKPPQNTPQKKRANLRLSSKNYTKFYFFSLFLFPIRKILQKIAK
ncbi:MAG: hypothetical protein RL757_598 [Bacteroidota bacterium]